MIADSSSSWRRTRTERTRRHGLCEGICDITWRTMACSVLCVSVSVMDRKQNGGCDCHIGPAVSHPGARILATEVALQSSMGYNVLCHPYALIHCFVYCLCLYARSPLCCTSSLMTQVSSFLLVLTANWITARLLPNNRFCGSQEEERKSQPCFVL